MVVLRNGSICRIARNLEPENARELVVLLTHALAEMRIKEGAARGGPINVLID
jgi:hypothetical protein